MEQTPRDTMKVLAGDHNIIQSKISYVDGIGRPTQSILYRGSADGDKDILASTSQYDILGRQSKTIIPVASSTGDGAINNNAETLAKSFYQDQKPFTEVYEYDNSPLNRVLKNYGVGEAWRTAQKTAQANFKVTTNYQVRGYVISSSGAVDNNYNPGAIFQNVTIDERGNDMSEYIDKGGKTVLKAVKSDNGYFYTAYIYDDMNRLRFIVPPKSYDLQDSFIEDSDYFREGIFAYKYDQRGRVKAKHIAGAGWTFIVYDKRDLPVMTQDSKDRENNRYQFTKYDAWARPIFTGFVNNMGTDTTARNNLQNLFEEVDGITIPFEERSETGDILLHYTNDRSFPITVKPIEANVLTATYYDDYANWTTSNINFKADSAFHTPYPNTNGLMAGMQYRNLGNSNWLYLSNFYDDKGRTTQQNMTNHLGETDRMDTEYRFNGEIKTQRAIYRRPSQTAVTIKTRFRYDHQSRKIAMFYILNGDSLKMAGYQYDPIGRLSKKSLMPLNEVFSKQSGLWTQASTWKLGDIPMINDHVTINNGHTISIPSNSIAKAGKLNDFGTLTMSNTSTLNMGRPRNTPLQVLDYSYHIRGGLKGYNLNASGNPSLTGGDLFSLKLGYEEDGTYYDKNIRSQTWISAVDGITRSYTYSYDNSNRILGAVYAGGKPNENYSLENMSYDQNGNILSLWRKGMLQTNTFDYTDKLGYSYGTYSNKLDAVTDAVNGNLNTGDFRDVAGTNDYSYWNDGSLKSDLNKGIDSIKYNHLKLPNRIKFSNGRWIQYWYDALGKKLRKTTSENITTDYLGGLIYENNNLYQITNDEGRFTNGLFEYGITDHLGNLRLSFKDSSGIAKITQAQDYEPWGGENWTSRYVNTGLVNRHKFNGKEQIQELGLYEYGFRWYDPNDARFITIDPLAEKYPYKSTYDYAENEPIGGIDLDGLERVAISGAAPPSQYKPNGTSYNADHVKYFYAQTLNLQKYGFVPFQAYNGQQLLGALEKTTKEHGNVSFLALFGHAGYTDNNGGLFLSHNEGFYSQPLEVRQAGNKSASISDLTKMIEEKDIKFAKDAVCFIDGCNTTGGGTPDFRSDPSHRLLGEELVMKTGVTVIGGTGHVEMSNQKLADGRFIITDGGNFYKLTRTTEQVPNPTKSWWEFWKPDTIEKTRINAQNLGSTINLKDYVK
jgi:RHS repeat-associated protein